MHRRILPIVVATGALIAGCGGSDSSEDSASDSDDAATATVTAEDDSVDTAASADDSGDGEDSAEGFRHARAFQPSVHDAGRVRRRNAAE